jgi:UDP-N-acetylglucosamine 1-carboxyvinyltransferase
MNKDKFIIQGGKKLKGEVEVHGAKNATFPILAASILTDEDVIIENIPLVEDVLRMIEILEDMGAKIEWKGKRAIKINNKDIDINKIDKKKVLRFRGSILLLGALLARFKEVTLPYPGGCIIGARPIDTHLNAFRDLDVKIVEDEKEIYAKTDGKTKRKAVILDEISVTGTENILLFAAKNEGEIVIKMADMDYPSQELIKFLRKMGVEIEIGFHVIKIKGKSVLSGAKHKIINDPIEAGTFIILAAANRGDVLVKGATLRYLENPLKLLKKAGVPIKIHRNEDETVDINIMPWDKINIKKIQSLPFPGFPSDLLPLFCVLATQAEGATIIHDPLYDGRLEYLKGLRKMGVDIFFSDPHRAIISGPTKLYGADLGSFDLRAGASLIIAGLMAKGETIIRDIYQVDRGYEQIEKRLQKLGADIKRA